MNRYKYIIAAAAIITAVGQSNAANPLVSEIAPYVYPQNRPAAPDGFTYMPDGKTYAVIADDGRGIECFDIRSGESTGMLVDLSSTRETRLDAIDGFTLSPDASQILMWTDSQPVYRRSFKARYYVYEVRSRLLRPLSTVHATQQSPIFSPNSRMVAFVSDNNIYVKKLDYQTEVSVTDDGAAGKVINGIPDWVYEEEFTTVCSMAWAPDNLTLCYLKYNETEVPTYDMTTYEGTCDPHTQYALYPGTWSYKYPVAGKPNSKVSLHSYDVETRKIKDIALPDERIEYIPRLEYGPDDTRLIVSTLNRDQNHFEIYSVNPKSTVAKSIYTEDSRSWIDPVTYENLKLLPDGFVVNSWRSGYNQLYQYSYAGAEMRQITSGDTDATAYYGCDAAGNHYYQVAAPTPLDRTVRRIDRKGNVTDLSATAGTSAAQFSPDMQYMMLSHSDVSHAPVYTLCTAAGKAVRTVEDNSAFMAQTGKLAGKREFFTMTSDGNILNGYVMRPTDFDASRKYPVIMYQYSGPGSQEVLNRWQLDWQDAFVRAGYVVMCVDGRGTGGRGRDFCDVVYRRLGYYETIDQIAAARHAASLDYVDASRIGIFGWSYGGYETLMAASAQGNPYKAAVAVAPVTDWRFYDSVYAERYMLTPQQNEDGYRESAPLNRAGELSCQLLLMYGTADDNVHPANSLQYVSALQADGVLCDMLVFPNMNHSINGCNARSVVYAKMLDWFNKNLK
ncbi:MAG: alpha/beta fold hydrolase [Bacteroidales bacterium]|nr:alpha/beta fold hydrolase [Bacteroidales bacterium]